MPVVLEFAAPRTMQKANVRQMFDTDAVRRCLKNPRGRHRASNKNTAGGVAQCDACLSTQHLVGQNSQRPPVHGIGVAVVLFDGACIYFGRYNTIKRFVMLL